MKFPPYKYRIMQDLDTQKFILQKKEGFWRGISDAELHIQIMFILLSPLIYIYYLFNVKWETVTERVQLLELIDIRNKYWEADNPKIHKPRLKKIQC